MEELVGHKVSRCAAQLEEPRGEVEFTWIWKKRLIIPTNFTKVEPRFGAADCSSGLYICCLGRVDLSVVSLQGHKVYIKYILSYNVTINNSGVLLAPVSSL